MKTKKKLKGMTLVECIVAMAVLAVAGAVMCTACSFTMKVKLTTNALNKRVSYEAPIADCRIVSVTEGDGSTSTYANELGTEYTYDDDGTTKTANATFKVSDGSTTYDVQGYLYEATYSGSSYGSEDGIVDVNSNGHNFKFFIVGGKDST
ncbi:MAG: prepilin-type N-terminal cleavage/methylation domain-containing protein [Ruminococcus sp.]|nr:prepilin-type N-terminal cleavage/methylation domain-containing protein [Ruminococcus sp.]